MRLITNHFVSLFLCAFSACPPAPESRPPQLAPTDVPAPAAAIPAETPLVPGHVVFSGMVRPTKGGYLINGVILDDSDLKKALANAPGRDAGQSEWFLGAVVRIEGELRGEAAPPERRPDEPIVQQRSGPSLTITRIDTATIVKPAEVIEGTIARSKGLFEVGGHLITRQDLAWSLAPQAENHPGRIRLYGQSRTVVCEPNAQCLIGGSLPMFDIGRAQRLP